VSTAFPDIPGFQVMRAIDARVNGSFDSLTPVERQALDYALVIENHSGQSACAYTVRVTYTESTGKKGVRTRQYFQCGQRANGMAILPGERRLVGLTTSTRLLQGGPVARVNFAGGYKPEVHALLASKQTVSVSLDLLVLDNGQVFGKDESASLSYLETYLASQRETAAIVNKELENGSSLASISQILMDFSRRRAESPAGTKDRWKAHAAADVLNRFLHLASASSADPLREGARCAIEAPSISLHRL
jgi:hypothetical protein